MQALRGHTGDVVGMAWAPDSQRIATVSLDNTVRVWNVGVGDSVCEVLQGHAGMVKGIAWDPIGRYIASQGDDKAVVIWDTRHWKEVARVEKHFEHSSQK